MASGRFEDANSAEHVHLGVLDRALDRDAHIRLCGQMEHGLGPNGVEDVVKRLADVAHVEHGAGGDVLLLAVDERVDHGDLVAPRHERVDDVRADESRAPGDD